jgi:hypothetical protein
MEEASDEDANQGVAVSSTPRLRAYHSCCRGLVKHLHEAVVKEKSQKKLLAGYGRAIRRMVLYTGLSTQTICRLIGDEELPVDC